MRVFVSLAPTTELVWCGSVRIADGTLLGTRELRRLTRAGMPSVPLPPESEANNLDANAKHKALCTAADPDVIFTALDRLLARTASADEIEAFGRYLFQTLLGHELWTQILAEAPAGAPVELRLLWNQTQSDLYRLPWELMHGAMSFICADPHRSVSVVHEVESASDGGTVLPESTRVTVRPRVLFVVGAELTDEAVQAGSEFLGVLRNLRSRGFALDLRVLIDATPERLQSAMREFAPSIVHLISHGAIGKDGRGHIYLLDERKDEPPRAVTCVQLLELLRVGQTLPSVVVLNACSTGGGVSTAPRSQVAAPLAAELVQAGIPVVLGQSGRVSDHICRLFSIRLYEALLKGESVSHATSEGRRAAVAFGYDPRLVIDWALATIFVGKGVDAHVDVQEADEFARKEARTLRFLTLNNPPTFYARFDCVEAFTDLISAPGRNAKRLLGFEVTERDSQTVSPQYGKTRLLEELASRAVFEGVAPCLVTLPKGDELTTVMDVGLRIHRAIEKARIAFELETPKDGVLLALFARARGNTLKELPTDLTNLLLADFGNVPDTFAPGAAVVRAAISRDLIALATQVLGLRGANEERRPAVVVLIDELHRFGDATRDVLETLVTPDGLGSPTCPIPVVVAFSSGIAASGVAAALAITRFFEMRRPYSTKLPLGAFARPYEDQLVYRQHLLNLKPSRVVSGDQENVQSFFDELHESVRGVPSRLEVNLVNGEVELAIRIGERFRKCVFPAADDERFAAARP